MSTAKTYFWEIPLVTLAAAAAAWGAVRFCLDRGYLLDFGDAQAHLNIARRVVDGRTPGIDQLGTVWLPLPHILMLPLAGDDWMWRTGLAGAIPASICFVLGVVFLFAAVRRAAGSRAAAWTAAAAAIFNPNLLYLQATPMTEAFFFCFLAALLYFALAARTSLWAAAAAGLAAFAVSLTRYEGWPLLPFVALYLLIGAKRRFSSTILFSAIAAIGPFAWLGYNWWFWGNPLEFYNGPYSPQAIQGAAMYPGRGNFPAAWAQFQAAATHCAGPPLFWLGAAGAAAALVRRISGPFLFLAIPAALVVWSVYSGNTPIFVPDLPPGSYYNTRYGLALFPLLCAGLGCLVPWVPSRLRAATSIALIVAVSAPWLADRREDAWITWKEARVNSEARRAWTLEAAAFFNQMYRPGDGVLSTFGDVTGVFREAGIPLRRTLTWDNGPEWNLALARPQWFLREEWALAVAGDVVQTTLERAWLRGPRYTLVKRITVRHSPVLEIYRRGDAALVYDKDTTNENSVYQGPRGAERLPSDLEPRGPSRAAPRSRPDPL